MGGQFSALHRAAYAHYTMAAIIIIIIGKMAGLSAMEIVVVVVVEHWPLLLLFPS